MTRRAFPFLLSLLVAWMVLVGVPAVPSATPPSGWSALDALQVSTAEAQPSKANQDKAATRFKKGYELFREGDFEAALIEFRRAYDLAPNYAVLYNIGQVYYQLQDYAGALKALEQYLEDGGAKVPAKRRASVEKDIEKLKSRVGTLAITTNVDGAEIAIDDVVVGTTPLDEPILVSAGRRKVAATKDGRMPVRKVVEVAGEEEQSLKLDLPELAKGQPSVVYVEGEDGDSPKPPPDGGEESGEIPWVAWGITGGFGVATGVFAVITVVSESDLTTTREDAPATTEDLDSASTQTTAFAAVTDVLLAATVIAGGISLYLTIDSLSGDGGDAGGDDDTVSAEVGLTPGGFAVRGTF